MANKVSLREWQRRQNQQKKEWREENSEYAVCARRLHRIYQSLAFPKTSKQQLSNYYSLESSTFWPHLIKTAQIVVDSEFDPKTYLQAQFDFFSKYFGKIPFPAQLHTSNAVDRYTQYAANQALRIEKQNTDYIEPKVSAKTLDRERRKMWAQRISQLSRPRGASDAYALIAHCVQIPAAVLVEYGVWDQCKDQWEAAHSR